MRRALRLCERQEGPTPGLWAKGDKGVAQGTDAAITGPRDSGSASASNPGTQVLTPVVAKLTGVLQAMPEGRRSPAGRRQDERDIRLGLMRQLRGAGGLIVCQVVARVALVAHEAGLAVIVLDFAAEATDGHPERGEPG